MDKVVKEYKSFANGDQGGLINRPRWGSLKNDIKHSTDVCAATMPLLIKPHLNPSTLRSQFSPEPSLPPLGWSQRTTFDLESSPLPRPHLGFRTGTGIPAVFPKWVTRVRVR